jgi:hypothetical protein
LATSPLLLLLLIPGVAWADPPFSFTPENFPIVLTGELIPVLLETMLLRHWLKLRFRDVLPAALVANATSFAFGVLQVGFISIFWQEAALGHLNDLFTLNWKTLTVYSTLREDYISLGTYFAIHLGIILILTFWAVIVETLIYSKMLSKKAGRPAGLLSIAANAISYPVYYTAVAIAILIVQVVRLAT